MAKRNTKNDSMATPQEQQKAKPVEPPKDGDPRRMSSPMSFFNDPREGMQRNKGGIRDFTPKRGAPGGNPPEREEGSDA